MKRVWQAMLAVVLAASVVGSAGTAADAAAGSPLSVVGVVASADDGNVAANTLDNNLSTRWSAEGDGVWIQYDLGTAQTIGSVSIAWHKGDTRRDTFDVLLSNDATSWTPVLSGKTTSGTTLQLQNYDFAAAKNFPLWARLGEQTRLQFRADFFNLFNHTNFANPVGNMSNASFGKITQTVGTAVQSGALSTTGGPMGGPRLIQVSLRLQF